jgi:hypothetical protein
MAKKNKLQPEQPSQAPAPAVPEPPAPPAREDVSTAQIWTFWIGVALAVVIARVLNHFLPGVPESVIERWVMLGFAIFMAGFLIKIR